MTSTSLASTATPPPPPSLNADDYIRTASGNFVSRQATLQGASKVELKGRSWIEAEVLLRGDLANLRVGRYCSIGGGTTIAPPVLLGGGGTSGPSPTPTHAPVSIGSHTTIGNDCRLEAAAIGSYNWIGAGVTLGPRVMLKDAVVVAAGTVIAADTVVPPFTRVSNLPGGVGGCGALQMTPLSPATTPLLQEAALDAYHERVRLVTGSSS
jgi:dynactin-5